MSRSCVAANLTEVWLGSKMITVSRLSVKSSFPALQPSSHFLLCESGLDGTPVRSVVSLWTALDSLCL